MAWTQFLENRLVALRADRHTKAAVKFDQIWAVGYTVDEVCQCAFTICYASEPLDVLNAGRHSAMSRIRPRNLLCRNRE